MTIRWLWARARRIEPTLLTKTRIAIAAVTRIATASEETTEARNAAFSVLVIRAS